MSQTVSINRTISVAPMLDWTDKHCRYFLRLISRHALLYTEMVTTGAIIHGKGDYLAFNDQEHPVALQLGGSDPSDMAACAEKAQAYGYDEVNINVGCPSDRVQNGRFGACLMAEPDTVASCVAAMQQAVDIPVTVKSRIGIDDMDEYEDLSRFVSTVQAAGCDTLIVHARKAWLQGLSPKENRDIPPLMYDRVYALKEEFPDLHISINGGIKTLDETEQHLSQVDGVMIGREVYSNPYILSSVDQRFYNDTQDPLSRQDIVTAMVTYTHQQVAEGARPWHIARHMLGLFQGEIGARIWRRYLSQHGPRSTDTEGLLFGALEQVEQAQRNAKEFLANKVG
ncbi:tRNA dihydrouridine(20/20a) synthase DusA [Aestuariibacter halophilus]|uniref:tRNA-dihydrouridine(20/20a) synthase n=1 Tax=Fluctibacter halophilus TaxID=226011 RepID=A0ABS8GAG1_9ALTE|nr:tRNA dihydrouridine(20/20a) synthase DusA [Aestuariibacter halophilus]MCC2617488.1 tRNA dihydrouridine(20/20a) synthase DusA [Aestuariibacter halophilus]